MSAQQRLGKDENLPFWLWQNAPAAQSVQPDQLVPPHWSYRGIGHVVITALAVVKVVVAVAVM